MSHNSELSPNTSGVTPKKRSTKTVETKKKPAHEPCEPCDALPASFTRHVRYGLSRGEGARGELFQALALSVKEQMLDDWRETRIKDSCYDNKQVAYLSLEFLMGRTLGNALLNLELEQDSREALSHYSVSLEEIEEAEHDAGLGNGGLGRLAACFLDSCASMDLSVTGYGIRYEYGMFAQKIVDGYQVERPDRWLREGNPWEVRVPHHNVTVKFFGHTESMSINKGAGT